ncbi:glucose-1-phosphate adenylyltransferase [Desulfofalx alkaliphila]|uniref:glucose-1-phosphate adenylyltransferase n=1 Tax=Desulfofalx alkaliphila TaxID=105483 RepID=UPI0004E1F929|nr:glucose-1-phosphate adenylyltransferase [Desulfofalx alkaliphila]
MRKKQCVAMLLAGGQGSRLGILTHKLAKPAVPFGGKYRIIDFPLSNCYNSGIDTVGVLTQYQPLKLNSYIGIGSPWDLDRKNGGVTLLPPFVREKGGEWYKGTANAIYQNISFLDIYNPDYVLVLSGDHIYKMDYSLMLEYHKNKNADATIAVIKVPWDEAHRFGILNTDLNNKIIEFEEKPKNPKSNYASMGIYTFNWKLLREYLIADEKDADSENDFGKNIIPKMLTNGENLFAYNFTGYWKDVGTVKSLWEANMDLLSDNPKLDLYDPHWRIYSVNPSKPPQYISEQAVVTCSLISEGCQIFGNVNHSVLFTGVYVGEGSVIKDSIIMPGVTIGRNVLISKAIVCEKTVVGDNCIIGYHNEGHQESLSNDGITVIGENTNLPNNTKIPCNLTVSYKFQDNTF